MTRALFFMTKDFLNRWYNSLIDNWRLSMPLDFNYTGQTTERRNEEATKIFKMLLEKIDFNHLVDYDEGIAAKEAAFLQRLNWSFKINKGQIFVTGKELTWLRDLKEKYL